MSPPTHLRDRLRLAALVAVLGATGACDPAPPSTVERRTEPTSVATIEKEHSEAASPAPATFVGRARCVACHATEVDLWRGSHHDLAMDIATSQTVLGDFDDAEFVHFGERTVFHRKGSEYWVETAGPTGVAGDYRVAYTFGVRPLQQYLIDFGAGRYQCLGVAWATREKSDGGQRWFHLYPNEAIPHDDVLHWTGALQNWNSTCAECHSTDLHKGFDAERNTYRTSWSEIDVSCEACHGPASRHIAWAAEWVDHLETPPLANGGFDTALADKSEWCFEPGARIARRYIDGRPSTAPTPVDQVDTCARCHSRRSVLTENYEYGRPLLDTHRPSLLTAPNYYADGQIRDEVYVYGSFLQSKMYAAGVRCTHCHEPHSLALRADGNALCTGCHREDVFDTASHHHHPAKAATRCVDCHMPTTTYMVVDPRRDHSFRVPRPDLTVSLGVPNACTPCHADRDANWAAARIIEWTGHEAPPHFGTVIASGTRHEPGATTALLRLAEDESQPAITRATAIALIGEQVTGPADTQTRLARLATNPDPLIRLGLTIAAESQPPDVRALLLIPLLRDEVRANRIEAARLLAGVLGGEKQGRSRQDERGVEAQFARAFEEFRGEIRANSDRAWAHVRLGLAELDRGDNDAAKRAYEDAIRIEPRSVPARINLADLFRLTGDEASAERVLLDARMIGDALADVDHALGLLYIRRGDRARGTDHLRRAADSMPTSPRYVFVYAIALDAGGDTGGAISRLEVALKEHPFDVQLLSTLVTFTNKLGRTEDAARYRSRLDELLDAR